MVQLAPELSHYPLELERRARPRGPRALSVIHSGDAPRVSVVIAALNEEESLSHVLSRLPGGLHEVILVDGHSTDRTIDVALQMLPDIRIVTQPGRGKGDALRAGFDATNGDIVIAIDADGSTDPREIPAFVGALLSGADYVKGSRFIPGGGTDDMTFTRKVGNLGLMLLARILVGSKFTDLNYGFTGFWRRELKTLDLRSTGFEIETEMNLRAAITNLKVVEVASFEQPRVGGIAHLVPLTDGWRVLMEIFRQSSRRQQAKARRRDVRRSYAPEAE